jgi:hypothetical protein
MMHHEAWHHRGRWDRSFPTWGVSARQKPQQTLHCHIHSTVHSTHATFCQLKDATRFRAPSRRRRTRKAEWDAGQMGAWVMGGRRHLQLVAETRTSISCHYRRGERSSDGRNPARSLSTAIVPPTSQTTKASLSAVCDEKRAQNKTGPSRHSKLPTSTSSNTLSCRGAQEGKRFVSGSRAQSDLLG